MYVRVNYGRLLNTLGEVRRRASIFGKDESLDSESDAMLMISGKKKD